ncbi:MAG TPA: formate dehydrogenase accessory protein FdhE [Acetobacteraceae bacterium]|nr:formate dehydrogenase accessory protein FdhE [Acetobacteraceae bacterium]
MAVGNPSGSVKARIGDPLSGIGQPVPIILPDPDTLFLRRTARLLALSAGHPMKAWLHFVAQVARAQHNVVRSGGFDQHWPAYDARPPLAPELFAPGEVFNTRFRCLLSNLPTGEMPDATLAVLQELRSRDPLPLAAVWLAGRVQAADTGPALFIAAALQVIFACRAAALDVARVNLLPQRGLCPVCGSMPVGAMVTASGRAPGTRYLHCGLCATAWNHVRAVCVNCGESRGLVLRSIEGAESAVKAETCSVCQGYIKVFYQEQDMQVEPLGDDLASLDLDLLVAEAGYARFGPNPLVLTTA